MTQTYPLPLTAAMLTPANANITKPRYTGVGAATDWVSGDTGNDVDTATASYALANSHSANVATDYTPRTQTAKAAAMVPPLEVLGDLGKDYGAYADETGRDGTITPRTPYPTTP